MAEECIWDAFIRARLREPTTAGPWVRLSDGRKGRFYQHQSDGSDPPLAAVVGPDGWAVFDERGNTTWDGTATGSEAEQWADMILRSMRVGMRAEIEEA